MWGLPLKLSPKRKNKLCRVQRTQQHIPPIIIPTIHHLRLLLKISTVEDTHQPSLFQRIITNKIQNMVESF